jgi:glycosyltransferase involved in cell wall biosynthesis
MKILFMRPRVELGGVAAHMELLSAGLQRHNVAVSLATAGGESLGRFTKLRIPVFECPSLHPSSVPNLLRSVLRLGALVRSADYDLLHSHHRFTTTVGRFVSRLSGVPLLATVHEFKQNHRAMTWLWTGDAAIVPSNALREHLIAHYNVPPGRVHVVYNAVEAPRPSTEELTHNRPLRVGYIGRLSPEKGARYFLDSVPLIRSVVPDVRFVIAGTGPEEPELRKQASALGLDPTELFLGSSSNVPMLLKSLDLVVVPSLAESFSLVALEAMHYGRPVVASAVGGIPEVVRHEETGLLVPPGDAAALAQAVKVLAVDPARRAAMGARAIEVARTTFSPVALVEQTLAVYASLIGPRMYGPKQQEDKHYG